MTPSKTLNPRNFCSNLRVFLFLGKLLSKSTTFVHAIREIKPPRLFMIFPPLFFAKFAGKIRDFHDFLYLRHFIPIYKGFILAESLCWKQNRASKEEKVKKAQNGVLNNYCNYCYDF